MSYYKIAVSKYALSEKIPHGAPVWSKFNSSFSNALLKSNDLLDYIYTGHAITTHHKDRWRVTKNFLLGQHIALDFDSEDKYSTIVHLEKDKFIRQYASCIHTTMSHNVEHPRARVVFLLDEPIYQAKNYTLAASAMLWLFGTADRQCKDAVRFFYGSPKCEFSFINKILPLDVVKRIIKNYLESGAKERKRTANKRYFPPVEHEKVYTALQKIDPWKIEYDEWVSILMAIHSQFGDSGLSMAENWADGSKGEVVQKWKSFNRSGNETGAITIATVFGIANRFEVAQ